MEKLPTRLAADPTPAPAAPKVSPALDTETTSRLVPMFRVMIHNDPVTPMDFVVALLRTVFRKDIREAVAIMMEAHTSNAALVTVLPLEEAEHRVDHAHSLARTAKFPLTFTLEPE
ncbi:MAG: ATP-dependent Clp protease adaptor ClpS [Planctomycetes bacterium]|nr:ATP-dependent Clp protease adaptor ClpS [Planctomycetota bacterium]